MNIQPYTQRREKNGQKKRTIIKKLVHSQNPKPIQPVTHPHLKKKRAAAQGSPLPHQPAGHKAPLQPILSLSSPSPDFPSTNQRVATPPLFKKKTSSSPKSATSEPLHFSISATYPHRHPTIAPTLPSPRFQPFSLCFHFPLSPAKAFLSPQPQNKPKISHFQFLVP